LLFYALMVEDPQPVGGGPIRLAPQKLIHVSSRVCRPNLSRSQLPVLFLLTLMSFSNFGCDECKQSDFSIDHLVMCICRVSFVLLEESVCYDHCVPLAKL